MHMSKPGADPVDLWRVEGTDKYQMFKKDGDGTVHGECQMETNLESCLHATNSWWMQLLLHCWQKD